MSGESLWALSDKVVLITGGTQGIGLGVAREFVRSGASVVVVGRDPAKLEQTVADLGQLGEVTGRAADVSQVANIEPLVSSVLDQYGRIDVLLNFAGVIRPASFLDTTEEDYDQQMATNVKGTFFMCQAAGRHMVRAGSGRIVNVSSVAGQRPFPPVAVYCGSKAAVEHLTRVMALDLAPHGVNVNCIVPGNIEMPTNIFMQEPGAAEASAAATPARRNGRPEDIASTALFLASDAAAFFHGVSVVVDGGVRLNS